MQEITIPEIFFKFSFYLGIFKIDLFWTYNFIYV